LNAPTVARLLHLLGVQATTDPAALADLTRYGLGSVWSLAAYEAFSGVNFRARSISARARRGEFG
jgi:hypothetical protein